MSPFEDADSAARAVADATAEATQRRQVVAFEQTLWSRLDESAPFDDFCQAWLTLQCQMVSGVRVGVCLLAGESERPAAAWPEDAEPPAGLLAAAALAIEQRRAVMKADEAPGPGLRSSALAVPILLDGEARGAVALALVGPARSFRPAMRQLHWGVGALQNRLRLIDSVADRLASERTAMALELVAEAAEAERFLDACRAVTTELALRSGCDRISLGFMRRGYATVYAISHSAQFGKQMALVRALGAAMDEAIDQRAVIVLPGDDEDPVADRAHQALARAHAVDCILTTPLLAGDEYVGAILCERSADRPFDLADIELIEGVASAVAPILHEKRQNDRWLVAKAADAAAAQVRRLLGPGHLGRKLFLAALVAAGAFGWFAKGPYRVHADAVVEGEVRRELVAATDGYIKSAAARAGDVVAAGDVLAVMDDRDLSIERLRWTAERQKLLHERGRALAERDRAETQIISAQIEQADAQIALIDAHLDRLTLRAPFDGLVVAGDLSQAIGGTVARGDVLFELAPLDAYRVVLRVDESQVGDVRPGQRGRLLVVSLPDRPLDFVVERVTPVAVAEEGRNAFEVEARVEGDAARLRPGMEGVGKVEVEERRLVWIWARPLIDWARLALWRWTG